MKKFLFILLTLSSSFAFADFSNTAKVYLGKGKVETYFQAAKDHSIMAKTTEEAGYISYAAYQHPKNKQLVIFNELWETQAHLGAHLGSPHMIAFFTEINFNPADKVNYREIKQGNTTTFFARSKDLVIQKLVLIGSEVRTLK